MTRTTIRSEDITAGQVPGQDDLQTDIALLGFKVAANGSLAAYNLKDQFVDAFEDASGVDASASTDEIRNASNYYSGGQSTAANATGGTITTDGSDTIHTFSTSNNGTSTNDLVAPSTNTNVRWLLVAGGGGGGNGRGGGGGGGGYVAATGQTITSGTHAVVAGAGGANGASFGNNGSNGSNSTIGSLVTATGGGGGGGYANPTSTGSNGGSGGGAGGSEGGSGVGGTGSQGNNGGTTNNQNCGGGGGGAGAVGGNSTATNAGGTGGNGTANDISGSSVTYAGGGGGGGNGTSGASGGSGGGGTGGGDGVSNGGTGSSGLGGGGGGGGNGANGGDGIVIIRYATDSFSNTTYNDMTLVSNLTTAEATPTTGDIVMTYTNGAGTATINTDLKAYISRDNGTTYTQATLSSEGTTGGHTILTAHNVDISGQPSGTSMRYKIETLNQSASKETRIQAVSLGWS